jgi:hypothetical protein
VGFWSPLRTPLWTPILSAGLSVGQTVALGFATRQRGSLGETMSQDSKYFEELRQKIAEKFDRARIELEPKKAERVEKSLDERAAHLIRAALCRV